jgi:hypothetical protein
MIERVFTAKLATAEPPFSRADHSPQDLRHHVLNHVNHCSCLPTTNPHRLCGKAHSTEPRIQIPGFSFDIISAAQV